MKSGAGGHDNDGSNQGQGHGDGRLRSGPSRVRSFIRFVNFTERRVDVIWLNHEGFGVRYRTLAPQQAIDVNTFVGHPWIFRDSITGDRLHVQLREVYEPVAWNADSECPRRRQVYITNQLYSLRDRCIQEVRRLVPPNRIHQLELPREVSRDLQTHAQDVPVVSLYDQAARSIVANRVGSSTGDGGAFIPTTNSLYRAGLARACTSSGGAAISPSLVVVSGSAVTSGSSSTSLSDQSSSPGTSGSNSQKCDQHFVEASSNSQSNVAAEAESISVSEPVAVPGSSTGFGSERSTHPIVPYHRDRPATDMAHNNNNNNELAVDRNCNNNNNANVANQNRYPAANESHPPVPAQGTVDPPRDMEVSPRPSSSLDLQRSAACDSTVNGRWSVTDTAIAGSSSMEPQSTNHTDSESRHTPLVTDSIAMVPDAEVETIILPVPCSRLPPSVGRTVLDGLSFPAPHTREQRAPAASGNAMDTTHAQGSVPTSNGQLEECASMESESQILPSSSRQSVPHKRDVPPEEGGGDLAMNGQVACSDSPEASGAVSSDTSHYNGGDKHFLPLKKRRK